MSQAHHELRASTTELITDTLGLAEFARLEQAHPQTAVHAVTVGTVLGAVALNHGASQAEANSLKLAGGLHDIGKPLSKRVVELIDQDRALLENEVREVRVLHTVEGSNYLDARGLGLFALIAGNHHGSLAEIEATLGTASPVGALTLATKIADIAEAMTDFTGRSYLQYTLPRQGLAEIQNGQLRVNPERLANFILTTCGVTTVPVFGFPAEEIIYTTFALKGLLPGTLDD